MYVVYARIFNMDDLHASYSFILIIADSACTFWGGGGECI